MNLQIQIRFTITIYSLNYFMKYFLILAVLWTFLWIPTSYAHQPRMPEGNSIVVLEPEISKAYYTQLSWQTHVYTLSSSTPFELYINILLPYKENPEKNISFTVVDKRTWESRLFDGKDYTWKTFFEPFGYDTYLQWPEYKEKKPAGDYEIIVSSPLNQQTYALAIGEAEQFDLKETINALNLIPKIKRDFFWTSPISFLLSPMGWWYVLIMFMISFLFWFLYRTLLKVFSSWSPIRYNKNIATSGRWMRAICWVILLIIAVMTSWSPFMLFFSGFCFFESLFSRCWLNAALGRNTCSI